MPVRLQLIEPDGSPYLAGIEAAAREAEVQLERWGLVGPARADSAGATRQATVLAIGPGVREPVRLARRLRAVAAEGPLLFLAASAAAVGSLRAELAREPSLQQRHELMPVDDPARLASRLRRFAERLLRQQRHRQAVEQISRQLASLAAEEPMPATIGHYLASVLAQASDAIISTDAAGLVRTWNVAAEQLFGYTAEAAMGRPMGFLSPEGSPPEAESLGQTVARVLRTRLAEQVEVACRRADGGLIDVSVSLAPIRNAAGEVVGLSAIARGAADRQPAEQALREASQQKNEFLALMSHELRTPLTTILGYTDMLLRGLAGPLAPRTTSYLGNVRGAGDRLLALVNSLLDYTRLEAGTERVELKAVDLKEAAERAVQQVQAQAQAKEIQLQVAAGALRGRVLADEGKVQNILGNFLTNAMKFTPRGGTVRVEVGRDPEVERMARVAVSDSGIGLRKEQLERVWDRFYQADALLTRQCEGMGLGLAIARHLAALHRGRVGAQSDGPGAGSTFWLSLPLADW